LQQPLDLAITATPIPAFLPSRPTQTRFGALTYRSGLVLSARHAEFGGFSGLWRHPNGRDLVVISDKGHWLTATLQQREGRLTGLSQARLAPILGPRGQPLWRNRMQDTEALAMLADGTAFISVERVHQVLRFAFGRDGVMAQGQIVPTPREIRTLSSNQGLEALGQMPARHPLAGALIAIAEGPALGDEPMPGWLIGGPKPGRFQVRKRDGYRITDLALLPAGDMLILERWYVPWRGVGMRIRRIAGHDIMPGALLDGSVLIEADLGHEIDNMEGLAVHQEGGRTFVTVISDDNFSPWQRTLLLEFELVA
jgi:hypothetical protein